jgi:hypothetical protein
VLRIKLGEHRRVPQRHAGAEHRDRAREADHFRAERRQAVQDGAHDTRRRHALSNVPPDDTSASPPAASSSRR